MPRVPRSSPTEPPRGATDHSCRSWCRPTSRWTGPLRLAGRHQRRNAAVAFAALQQLPAPLRPDRATIDAAFATATVPGRFDRRGKWLFDVAHNPDSMRALVDTLHDMPQPRPIHALVSILGDKEWPEMLVALDTVIDVGILTVAPSADTRRWDLAWLERWLADPAAAASARAMALAARFRRGAS